MRAAPWRNLWGLLGNPKKVPMLAWQASSVTQPTPGQACCTNTTFLVNSVFGGPKRTRPRIASSVCRVSQCLGVRCNSTLAPSASQPLGDAHDLEKWAVS